MWLPADADVDARDTRKTFHLQLAKDNGAKEAELIEAITHLAFYTGWPKAMAAMAVAKQVFRGDGA